MISSSPQPKKKTSWAKIRGVKVGYLDMDSYSEQQGTPLPQQRNKSKLTGLPNEITPPVTKRSFILATAGTVFLVLLINMVAGMLLKEFTPNVGYRRVNVKWNMVLNVNKPYDWLILGDSTCELSINPDVFEKQFGGSAMNLCTNGNLLAVNDVWMLEEYIKRKGPPKNIMIMHAYDVLYREMKLQFLAQIPLRPGFWKDYSPRFDLSKKQMITYLVDRYFPLYSQSTTVSNLLQNPFPKKNERVSYFDNGHLVLLFPDAKELERDLNDHQKFLAKNTFQVSTANQEALKQLALLTEKYGFNVYIVDSPIYDGLYKTESFQRYYADVKGTWEDLAKRSNRIHYVFPEKRVFNKDEVENVDHLVGIENVDRYTLSIAQEISRLQNLTAAQ